METIENILDACEQIHEELKGLSGEKARMLGCQVALIIPLVKIQGELDDKDGLTAALKFAEGLLRSIPGHLLMECDLDK